MLSLLSLSGIVVIMETHEAYKLLVSCGHDSTMGAPQEVSKPASRRVLVVDDNVDGARSLTILLRLGGHQVHMVHDGLAALDVARTWTPEVVLLDIGLPLMSGLEVARHMRGELGLTSTLIVAMTGYGQDEDRHRSQEAGFNAHLIKPLDLDELRVLLARQEAANASASK